MYKQEIKLIIESKIINIELLSNAARGICKTVVKDDVLAYQLVLCLVEAATNVIVHAYHRQPNHWLEVNVILDKEDITFELLDNGDIAALPEFKRDPNYNAKEIHNLPESGMGLFLIHSFMDDVSYGQNAEGKNIFKMIKKLEE